MKRKIGDRPLWEVEFDQNGALTADSGLSTDAELGSVRNLFVFSHGWNTSFTGARNLYAAMFELISGQLTPDQRGSAGFVGVLWPSLLFPEDGPDDNGAPLLAQTSSSGAALATALAPKFPGKEQDLEHLGQLLDTKPADGAKLDDFHAKATGLVTTERVGGKEDLGEETLIDAAPKVAIDAMAASPGEETSDTQSSNPFEVAWHGARELLRTMSYYEMKNRAGVVGQRGLAPLLAKLSGQHKSLRIHLSGHSFGARLVSFSLTGLPDNALDTARPVKSLVLIQGAFSHYSFSPQHPGALQAYSNRVDGPLVATFSQHDRAVGLWYPNASRLAREDNQGLSDFNKRWGAVGHDGYQHRGTETKPVCPSGGKYGFEADKFYSVNCDSIIKTSLSAFSGAHSDIRHPEVTWPIVSAAHPD